LLILVGSDISVMEAPQSYGHPFSGRATKMTVNPLHVGDVRTATGLGAAEAVDALLITGGFPETAARRRAGGLQVPQRRSGAMAELPEAADEVLLGLGAGVTRVRRKMYAAYQRLRNFARVIPPQQTKVHLKADPKAVDLVPGSPGM
jgi:hypothetical protein